MSNKEATACLPEEGRCTLAEAGNLGIQCSPALLSSHTLHISLAVPTYTVSTVFLSL